MTSRRESVTWIVAFVVLAALAVPWFLWRDARTALGLPLWLWWHVGWMALTALTFYVFTRRAWGVWVEGWSA
ncbi:MAG: DUF3311 domain-containing protein [Halobacteriaceae archaeon]